MGYGAPEQAMNAEIKKLRIEVDLLRKQMAEMRRGLEQHYSNHVVTSNRAIDQIRLDTY